VSATETVRRGGRDEPARAPREGERRSVREWASSLLAVVAGCAAVAALTLLVPSSPAYDPWAWIIWGREILDLDLNTRTGPSWKPLPILFTTPFSLAGDAAVALWMVVGRAGALLASVAAYRLAARLGGPLAGVLAAAGLVVIGTNSRLGSWFFNGALANSEGLLVALSLLAVERHLEGRPRQAFALGFGAALLRPEVWPFLLVYGALLWWRDRGSRRLVAALLALVPIAWFGPDLATQGDPFTGSSRARNPDPDVSPAFADNPALAVAERFDFVLTTPVDVGFLVALVFGIVAYARRGELSLLFLAGSAAVWVAIVALMTEAGYAGNERYLLLAAALATVAAAVGWARLVSLAGTLAARVRPGRASATVAQVAAAAALGALSLLWLVPAAEGLVDQARVVRYHGQVYNDVEEAIGEAGGRDAVLACGGGYTGRYHVPPYVWHLGVHFEDVTVFTKAPGTVFRAPPRLGDRPDPDIPATAPPYVRTGAFDEWEIYSTCPS
jgi:hypothetical protein